MKAPERSRTCATWKLAKPTHRCASFAPWRLRRQEFGEACDREFCGQAVLPVFGGAEEVLKLKQKHSPKRPQQRTTKTSAKGGKRLHLPLG